MLGVTIAPPSPVDMGKVDALARRHPMIQHLIEPGKRESAPQHAEHHDGGTTPDYRVRHRGMILQDCVLGQCNRSCFNLAESIGY
jgi:hypothetical protein